ncbi:cytochrome c [Variovorax sp. OV329]|uniref:SorU family sulfite dehydrogenase c-type cytochrome subunit n=1 Tax=Variovorax sp. OV329 TaxID=1882825 RepID=UPI0008E61921|nr:cytochrome c [Variovorax sp. OV329]SFM10517.1 sulfite dehydrogenase (cytochrome) subunit SorB [Variovorax sp. OV329]
MKLPVMSKRALALLAFVASPTLCFAQADVAEGRQIFVKGAGPLPACALCHALKDAGSTGAIGPDLDEMRPDAKRVETVLRNGMGPMPAFGTALSDAQIQAVVRYVVNSTNH